LEVFLAVDSYSVTITVNVFTAEIFWNFTFKTADNDLHELVISFDVITNAMDFFIAIDFENHFFDLFINFLFVYKNLYVVGIK